MYINIHTYITVKRHIIITVHLYYNSRVRFGYCTTVTSTLLLMARSGGRQRSLESH